MKASWAPRAQGWGGDEFAKILPNTDEEQAYVFAERIRADFKKAAEKLYGAQAAISVCGGVAEYRPGEIYDDFIMRADAAMRHAKSQENKDLVMRYSQMR